MIDEPGITAQPRFVPQQSLEAPTSYYRGKSALLIVLSDGYGAFETGSHEIALAPTSQQAALKRTFAPFTYAHLAFPPRYLHPRHMRANNCAPTCLSKKVKNFKNGKGHTSRGTNVVAQL